MNRIDQIALEAIRAKSLPQLERTILDYVAEIPPKQVKSYETGFIDQSGSACLSPSSVALILFEKYCRLWISSHPYLPVSDAVKEFLDNYGTWHSGLKEIALWRSCTQNGAPAEQIPEIEEFARTMIDYTNNRLTN